jgi:hypothetical protein
MCRRGCDHFVVSGITAASVPPAENLRTVTRPVHYGLNERGVTRLIPQRAPAEETMREDSSYVFGVFLKKINQPLQFACIRLLLRTRGSGRETDHPNNCGSESCSWNEKVDKKVHAFLVRPLASRKGDDEPAKVGCRGRLCRPQRCPCGKLIISAASWRAKSINSVRIVCSPTVGITPG